MDVLQRAGLPAEAGPVIDNLEGDLLRVEIYRAHRCTLQVHLEQNCRSAGPTGRTLTFARSARSRPRHRITAAHVNSVRSIFVLRRKSAPRRALKRDKIGALVLACPVLYGAPRRNHVDPNVA